ncbi:MAG: efflux RND transporter periplasmic adaptor subunit [Cytophagales bacterium]|nr:efflux RND transporter periplasmic adaptor subunit [Cytophagales bacterium]
MKKYIISAGVLSVLLLTGCQAEKTVEEQLKEKRQEIISLKKEVKLLEKELNKGKEKKVNTIPVKTEQVVSKDFESFFDVHGVVATNKNIIVNPEFSGMIKSIKVKEGQRVSKGQVLAVLDTELIERQIKEVEKGLEFATQVFQKQENLQKKNVGTEIQFLEAKNRKESLEKSLESLRSQLKKAYVKAPINGTIDEIFPNVGELASPQSPMVRLINISDVFVKTDISEAHLGKVSVGDEVAVIMSSLNETVMGKVTYVGKYINAMNRTFLVHVDIPNPKGVYLPNLLSVVHFGNEFVKDAVIIPTKVLQNDGKHDYVFTIENGVSHKKNLTIGSSYDGQTVIKEGLAAGEKLVVEGQTTIVEGSLVEEK